MGYSQQGRKESDMTEHVTLTLTFGIWGNSLGPMNRVSPWVKAVLTESPHPAPKMHAECLCHSRALGYPMRVFLTVDLDRLNDDVKRYSCTPRNYSVNLREELKLTNVVFFPRCLLVQRCGGNCGCGTVNWKSCACNSGKTVKKYHEVCRFQNFLLQCCTWSVSSCKSPGISRVLGNGATAVFVQVFHCTGAPPSEMTA